MFKSLLIAAQDIVSTKRYSIQTSCTCCGKTVESSRLTHKEFDKLADLLEEEYQHKKVVNGITEVFFDAKTVCRMCTVINQEFFKDETQH